MGARLKFENQTNWAASQFVPLGLIDKEPGFLAIVAICLSWAGLLTMLREAILQTCQKMMNNQNYKMKTKSKI